VRGAWPGSATGSEAGRRVPARRYLAALAVLAVSACSDSGPPVAAGVSRALAEQRAAVISDLNYRLHFDIPADTEAGITGRVVISFRLRRNAQPLQLDFRGVPDAIRSLTSNGGPARFRLRHEHIVLPASSVRPGLNSIEIEFAAGSEALNRNPDYLYTLFVPDRARTAFPLFDQPDLKATWDLSLTLPGGWVALSNAPVVATATAGGRGEYRFATTGPISAYLFSFVAGRFQSVTRERDGRSMTLLHRETDALKVAGNIEEIFDLHAAALKWLEAYTGIDYPFKKLDFALIPTLQYAGMEHAGAIAYRASQLLLEESPTTADQLRRAGLIAHETAHMWFGNLVTMKWFDDVWMKEVFANLMADRIVEPRFPDIDHQLNFLVRHYPAAYAVDRSAGANPIRQPLPNLALAGELYGAVIYDKAPIMLRQLEALVGAEPFREGVREYLHQYAYDNAGWRDLIRILDSRSKADLSAWSRVWVNSPGRPEFALESGARGQIRLRQRDPAGGRRVWPQRFSIRGLTEAGTGPLQVASEARTTPLAAAPGAPAGPLLFNADGRGYGLFPADLRNLQVWGELSAVERGSELINLYENLLAGSLREVERYFLALLGIIDSEQDPLLVDLAIGQMSRIYDSLLVDSARERHCVQVEELLWRAMLRQREGSGARRFFDAYAALASSPGGVSRLRAVWQGELAPPHLTLSEEDHIALAETLAIRLPENALEIIATQMSRIEDPDRQRRFRFIAPSLAPDEATRDAFFASLADPDNRRTEPWVLEALSNLHHPSRVGQSVKYLRRSLELLPELRATGDIFFPDGWLQTTLENHRSERAVQTVHDFLEAHPHLDRQLQMKILQAADMAIRAHTIRIRRPR
jgi:aminopeptidase N